MKLQVVKRSKQKIRISIQGDTHTGKTYSSLLLAYGMTGEWSKVAIIDTEHRSASFFSFLGPFNTVQIGAPFHVSKFIEAVKLCESAGVEVIILDSMSTEWVGEQGIIDIYNSTEGDRCMKYNAAIPLHNTFLSYLTESICHIICTVQMNKNKVLQQRGYLHHFTTAFQTASDYGVTVIKDRTQLFDSGLEIQLNESVGALINTWCLKSEETDCNPAINQSQPIGFMRVT